MIKIILVLSHFHTIWEQASPLSICISTILVLYWLRKEDLNLCISLITWLLYQLSYSPNWQTLCCSWSSVSFWETKYFTTPMCFIGFLLHVINRYFSYTVSLSTMVTALCYQHRTSLCNLLIMSRYMTNLAWGKLFSATWKSSIYGSPFRRLSLLGYVVISTTINLWRRWTFSSA